MSSQNLHVPSMYQKMLLKRMCGGKSRLGKNCEIFFNEEQSITEVKLKGLDHSSRISSSDWLGIQNSGFWVGIFFTFPIIPKNFLVIFDVFSKFCIYIKLCKLYF